MDTTNTANDSPTMGKYTQVFVSSQNYDGSVDSHGLPSGEHWVLTLFQDQTNAFLMLKALVGGHLLMHLQRSHDHTRKSCRNFVVLGGSDTVCELRVHFLASREIIM